jgi:hypothetical protein
VLASAVSLAVLAVVRVWAAFWLPVVRTWDDSGMRDFASRDAARTSLATAVRRVLLPDPRSMLDIGAPARSIGYHDWLVLFRRLTMRLDAERSWQCANLALYALQGGAIYLAGSVLRIPRALNLAFTFLFLSSHMVFGHSRWVLAETHVFAAFAVGFCACVIALRGVPETQWTNTPTKRAVANVSIGLACGHVAGMFTTLREYALLYYVVILAVAALGLIWDGRWWTAASFGLGLAPFAWALTKSIPPMIPELRARSLQPVYFHSVRELLPHDVVYFFGIPITIVGLLGAWSLVAFAIRTLRVSARVEGGEAVPDRPVRNGFQVLFVGLGIVVAGSAVQIATILTRDVRTGLTIIVGLLLAAMTSVRVWRLERNVIDTRRTRAIAIVLIAVSWVALAQQAVFRDHFGHTFGHPCAELGKVDYPLFIRRLPPDQMHIRCD